MQRTLKFDFVLDNEGLALVVNDLGKLGRNGMMSGLVFENETLVTLHALEDCRLFDRPGADIGPVLVSVCLFCVRGLPSCLPVIGELLQKRSFYAGGLEEALAKLLR